MDLLAAQDWLDIRSALTDVKDTFLKKQIIYRQRTARTLNGFHEKRDNDLQQTDYVLMALIVENSTDQSMSQGQLTIKGEANFAQSYALFDYQKLKSHVPPFIDLNGKSIFVPNKDTFIVNGEEVTILGVDLTGPTESDYQLVKVPFKKILNKGTPFNFNLINVSIQNGSLYYDNGNDPAILLSLVNGSLYADGLSVGHYVLTDGYLYFTP